MDGFGCAVAACEAGAACDEYDVGIFVDNPLGGDGANGVDVVFDEGARVECVTRFCELVDEGLAGGVVAFVTGVGDGKYANI